MAQLELVEGGRRCGGVAKVQVDLLWLPKVLDRRGERQPDRPGQPVGLIPLLCERP